MASNPNKSVGKTKPRPTRGSVTEQTDKEVSAWMCRGCKIEFSEPDSKLLECERCSEHYCIKCLKLSGAEYDLLNARSEFHWYCGICEPKVMHNVSVDKDVEQRCEEFMKRITNSIKELEAKVTKQLQDKVSRKELLDLTTKIDLLETKLVKSVDLKVEEKTVSFRDIMKSQLEDEVKKNLDKTVKTEVDCKMGQVSNDIEGIQKSLTETKSQLDEEREREKRRNNIVIYRIPESSETKKEDRYKEDADFCNELIHKTLLVDCTDNDVKKFIRLGEKQEGRIRPLLIEFSNRLIKNLIMESLSKLKSADDKFKNIVVAHDLTQNEREACRELVAEAKRREQNDNSGEYIFRVRGPPTDLRIVRLKKRQ